MSENSELDGVIALSYLVLAVVVVADRAAPLVVDETVEIKWIVFSLGKLRSFKTV